MLSRYANVRLLGHGSQIDFPLHPLLQLVAHHRFLFERFLFILDTYSNCSSPFLRPLQEAERKRVLAFFFVFLFLFLLLRNPREMSVGAYGTLRNRCEQFGEMIPSMQHHQSFWITAPLSPRQIVNHFFLSCINGKFSFFLFLFFFLFSFFWLMIVSSIISTLFGRVCSFSYLFTLPQFFFYFIIIIYIIIFLIEVVVVFVVVIVVVVVIKCLAPFTDLSCDDELNDSHHFSSSVDVLQPLLPIPLIIRN